LSVIRQLHERSTLYYMEVSGQLRAPDALPPGKQPLVPHWIEGWVSPRVVLHYDRDLLYFYFKISIDSWDRTRDF